MLEAIKFVQLNNLQISQMTEGDQEGVMDSLLEALSTGQAFKKEGRRRTPREKGIFKTTALNFKMMLVLNLFCYVHTSICCAVCAYFIVTSF